MRPERQTDIHGLEITDMTAKVDPNTGKITEYRAGVKISSAGALNKRIKEEMDKSRNDNIILCLCYNSSSSFSV
jgi:hypothetical protein